MDNQDLKMNPQKLMDELGIDLSEGDSLGMGVVRKETDLNNEEKQFLLAVERGDVPTARHFLEESQIYFNLNVNCVDPLGRTALLIAIENENIEMMQVLLAYNVELGDALLHAINEENVEAVELLLAHQAHNKKDLSVSHGLGGSGGIHINMLWCARSGPGPCATTAIWQSITACLHGGLGRRSGPTQAPVSLQRHFSGIGIPTV